MQPSAIETSGPRHQPSQVLHAKAGGPEDEEECDESALQKKGRFARPPVHPKRRPEDDQKQDCLARGQVDFIPTLREEERTDLRESPGCRQRGVAKQTIEDECRIVSKQAMDDERGVLGDIWQGTCQKNRAGGNRKTDAAPRAPQVKQERGSEENRHDFDIHGHAERRASEPTGPAAFGQPDGEQKDGDHEGIGISVKAGNHDRYGREGYQQQHHGPRA